MNEELYVKKKKKFKVDRSILVSIRYLIRSIRIYKVYLISRLISSLGAFSLSL